MAPPARLERTTFGLGRQRVKRSRASRSAQSAANRARLDDPPGGSISPDVLDSARKTGARTMVRTKNEEPHQGGVADEIEALRRQVAELQAMLTAALAPAPAANAKGRRRS
jgi:hypothetical protein